MNITRVKYDIKNEKDNVGLIALCTVVVEDCLKLSGIKLCRQDNGDYYLILPSKQDAFLELAQHNQKLGINISVPGRSNGRSKKVFYEEYFHPVTGEFYAQLKGAVVKGYKNKLVTGVDYSI